jgi:hypothetical protein
MYRQYNILSTLYDKQKNNVLTEKALEKRKYLLMIYSSFCLNESGYLPKVLFFLQPSCLKNGFSNQFTSTNTIL